MSKRKSGPIFLFLSPFLPKTNKATALLFSPVTLKQRYETVIFFSFFLLPPTISQVSMCIS
jgi:hypothetical protein